MNNCDPKDIALKSFFLGPHAENSAVIQRIAMDILERWFAWRRSLFPNDGPAISKEDLEKGYPEGTEHNLETNVRSLMNLYSREVPKFSPRYIGHMFSEISLPALFGHIVTLLHNPNNISGEASKAGLQIEQEAIESLAQMLGFTSQNSRGHFTSGGTVANFEGMIRARERLSNWLALGAWAREHTGLEINRSSAAHMGWETYQELKGKFFDSDPVYRESIRPYHMANSNILSSGYALSRAFGVQSHSPVILVPENKHYSWLKGAYLLGLGEEALWPIALDKHGKLSLTSLTRLIEKALLENRPIMMVVSVAGTTEMGAIDPISEVSDQLSEYRRQEGFDIWHHVDAAYGGFFCAMKGLDSNPLCSRAQEDLKAIQYANSVTLDPHKLGYVPYACGAFLTSDAKDYFLKSFGGPYVDYPEGQDQGLYTLEGSRSAAGAAATWMTAKCLGLDKEGTGRIIARTIHLTKDLESLMRASDLPIRIAPEPQTNILCFTVAKEGEPLTLSNKRAESIYRALHPCGDGPFFVSKTTLEMSSYQDLIQSFMATWRAKRDTDSLTLIRVCLMNPFLKTKESRIDYLSEFVHVLEGLVTSLDEN